MGKVSFVSSALKYNDEVVMARVIKKVSDIVAKESGNVFGEDQYSMVVNRIRKRMIDLGNLAAEEYEVHLQNNEMSESDFLVSLLTTHHTFFFREFAHFEFLIGHIDTLVNNVKKRGDNTISIYSAACSRGQEVYSLAMLFKTHMAGKYPGITFHVFGTDIDPKSVDYGVNGVFPYHEVKSIPKMYLSGNWQRGTGTIAKFARVKKELQKYCSFAPGNLLDIKKTVSGKKFDIILCRNVLIYFKHEDTEKIVNDIKDYIHPGGVLITGLSESLKSLKNPPRGLAPSVYSFEDAPVSEVENLHITQENPATTSVVKTHTGGIPSPVRILCVDDSPVIVKLLSKIFQKDPDFELVGVATNGIEAAEFLKNNEVDAMTLDIHMPEMDGVEYLKKHHHASHPKVVVVSSASREDSRYALETLKHGAVDFVEKPSLNNIGERAEEIKMKIKMAFFQSSKDTGLSSVDHDFSQNFDIENVDDKARAYIGSFSHLNAMTASLKELRGNQPPIFIFFEGNQNYLDGICESVSSNTSWPCHVWDEAVEVKSHTVFICDLARDMSRLLELYKDRPTSISIFGQCS